MIQLSFLRKSIVGYCFNLTVFIVILLAITAISVHAYILSYDTHISITEQYSDNLYQSSDQQEDDFITIISPGLRSDIRWQRTGFNASYDLGYSLYQKNSENDSLRHNASMGAWWDPTSNTQVRLGDTFTKSEDSTDFTDGGGGEFYRYSIITNSANFDVDYRFGERQNVSMGYAYAILENEGEDEDDSQSHHVNGALTYFFSPWVALESLVDYTHGMYDVGQDFNEWNGTLRFIKVISRRLEWNLSYSHALMHWEGDGTERDYQVYNPSLGVRYTIDNDSFMNANAGYFVQDIEGGENEKGFTLDGDIGKTWSFRRGSFHLTASSGYEDSQLGTENLGFTVYYGAESGFEYNMQRDLFTSVGVTFRNNDYINSDSDRNDKNVMASWALDWQIRQWLSSRFEYRFTNQDSNIDENDFTENRVQLTFSCIFTKRTDPRMP